MLSLPRGTINLLLGVEGEEQVHPYPPILGKGNYRKYTMINKEKWLGVVSWAKDSEANAPERTMARHYIAG